MRYLASEKIEIIRLVEQLHLLVGRTLAQLGSRVPRSTAGTISTRQVAWRRWRTVRPIEPGVEPHPRPDPPQLVQLALEQPDPSPRELAVRFVA